MGSIDRPINPIALALGAEGDVRRALGGRASRPHLQATLKGALGAQRRRAFVEIMQNCVIFNDGAFSHVTDRDAKEERVLYLEHGQPMLFGKERDKGIRIVDNQPVVARLGEDGVTEADILVHDETDEALSYMLSRLDSKHFPTPVGIFHRVSAPSLDEGFQAQIDQARAQKGEGVLLDLIHSGDVWEVK